MSELSRPLVVVGDVHLSRQRGSALERDLVRLIDAHPDAEIVFAGDSFDLSRVASASNVSAELASLLQERPMLQSSLAAHLARGAPLTLLAGNHDAPLMTEPCRRVVLDWLGLSE